MKLSNPSSGPLGEANDEWSIIMNIRSDRLSWWCRLLFAVRLMKARVIIVDEWIGGRCERHEKPLKWPKRSEICVRFSISRLLNMSRSMSDSRPDFLRRWHLNINVAVHYVHTFPAALAARFNEWKRNLIHPHEKQTKKLLITNKHRPERKMEEKHVNPSILGSDFCRSMFGLLLTMVNWV